jgi:hypothetical protein
MIYFPEEVISRDLCANDGFGTAEWKARVSVDDVMTATMESITFGMYQPEDGSTFSFYKCLLRS